MKDTNIMNNIAKNLKDLARSIDIEHNIYYDRTTGAIMSVNEAKQEVDCGQSKNLIMRSDSAIRVGV